MINIYLYYTSNKETADKLITHISFIKPKNPCLFLEQCFLFLKSDVLPVTFILDIIVDNIDIQRLQVAEFYIFKIFKQLQHEHKTMPDICNQLLRYFISRYFSNEQTQELIIPIYQQIHFAFCYKYVDFKAFISKFRYVFVIGNQMMSAYQLLSYLFQSYMLSEKEADFVIQAFKNSQTARDLQNQYKNSIGGQKTQHLVRILKICYNLDNQMDQTINNLKNFQAGQSQQQKSQYNNNQLEQSIIQPNHIIMSSQNKQAEDITISAKDFLL